MYRSKGCTYAVLYAWKPEVKDTNRVLYAKKTFVYWFRKADKIKR